MRFDQLAHRAGHEVRQAAIDLRPPSLADVRRSRRRRSERSVAFTAFVVTLAVIGAVALWSPTGGSEPVSPPPSPTTIQTETTVVDLSTSEYWLLDGRIVTIKSPTNLTLRSYAFFIAPPDIGGERHVTVSRGEPTDLAVSESAREETILSETATLWQADREGQPLFLSVDLGQWVAWLHVGDEGSRPSSDALLRLADQLSGTSDERGVAFNRLDLEYFELHLSGGTDEQATVRVGVCFNEMFPKSELVEDPRWGSVIRSAEQATWCIGEQDLEIEVSGRTEFIDAVVSTIEITVHEATP